MVSLHLESLITKYPQKDYYLVVFFKNTSVMYLGMQDVKINGRVSHRVIGTSIESK